MSYRKEYAYGEVSQIPDKPVPIARHEAVPVEVDQTGRSQVVTELALEEPGESGCVGNMGDMCENVSKNHLYAGAVVIGIAAALLVILLPMSFSTLEFHQYGFEKRKSTGSVNLNRVYSGGRYAIGPDYEFKKFPADAHFENFDHVTVFAADRLQVSITANMQYFLRQNQLALLHKNFDIHYAPVLRNNALDALKGAATLFSTREYIRERMKVEDALFKAVRDRLGGQCCEEDCDKDGSCIPGCLEYSRCTETDMGLFAEVRYFQLADLTIPGDLEEIITEETTVLGSHLCSCIPGCLEYSRCTETDMGLFAEVRYFQLADLTIPGDLEERYLRALVLQEETEAEQFRQEAAIVRKETDAMVMDIENEADEIKETANSQSSFIASSAAANATALVEGARTEGLKHLYSELSITTIDHKNSFDYLRTLREKENLKMAVDYDTNIAGPP